MFEILHRSKFYSKKILGFAHCMQQEMVSSSPRFNRCSWEDSSIQSDTHVRILSAFMHRGRTRTYAYELRIAISWGLQRRFAKADSLIFIEHRVWKLSLTAAWTDRLLKAAFSKR
jgi:hypothetical protein